jgi:hypothetical protein
MKANTRAEIAVRAKPMKANTPKAKTRENNTMKLTLLILQKY